MIQVNFVNDIEIESELQSLPTDIIRLILKYFLSNEDAIKCYLRIRIFHEACDDITLNLLKRKYFLNLMEFQPEEDYVYLSKTTNVCKCGIFYKNSTHRCLIRESIPDFCPYCLKQLRYEAEHDDICWVRNNHFKHKERFCIMHSKSLQNVCRKRKVKTKKQELKKIKHIAKKEEIEWDNNCTLAIIYLLGAFTIAFGLYDKYLSS